MTDKEVFQVNWPGRIVFGAGKLAGLGEEAKALGGRHALVITTKDLAKLGVVDRAERILRDAGLTATRFDDVQPDPTCEAVDQAAAAVRAAGVDLLVALGGGSAIDFAKALSAAATHDGPIWQYVTYTGANAKPLGASLLPLIAVPTTAGTGSEVSQGSVLDNPVLEMKAALLSPRMYPRVALVDPELTYTMPPRTTAMTGFDALTHGIESFLNVQRSTPASELFALEAVRRAAANLPLAVRDGGNHAARAEMAWAGTCGGLAIGLSNAAVAHAMALPLGARLGTPHGLALALLQPVVLAHTWEAQPERCATLAETVGAARSGMNIRDKAQAMVAWIDGFVEQIGLKGLWNGKGVDSAMPARLAKDVFAYMGRPVSQYRPVFDEDQVRRMFEEAMGGTVTTKERTRQ
jgi:alcohol dehydrogenase class IV